MRRNVETEAQPGNISLEKEGRVKMRLAITRPELCCLLLGVVVVLYGCATGTTRKAASLKSAKNVKVSAAELSSRNQSLLGLYSAEIETAADKIIQGSPSPVTRREALVWKAEAIPVLQTSLLNTDPVAAVVDTWAFLFQMRKYVEQPAVKQRFGEFQPTVLETLNRMEAQMEQLVQAAAPSANVADARQRVASWAGAHPIETGLSGRTSADTELIRAEQSAMGAVAAVRAIEESIGDLTARMDSYNAYLPKQARWQAELMLSDLTHEPQVGTVSSALEKTSSTIEQMPGLVEQTRAAVAADVDRERLAAQAFLREERLATLDALRQERIATIADVRKERVAATADLRGERKIVMDTLHNQEMTVMKELDTAREKTLQDFDARSRDLIDHFFVRAVEVLLLALVLCFLAVWILLRRLTPVRWNRVEGRYDRAA
jgi:hypothetical protein